MGRGTPRLRVRVKARLRTSVRGKYLNIKRHMTMHKHNTCIMHIYPQSNLSSLILTLTLTLMLNL